MNCETMLRKHEDPRPGFVKHLPSMQQKIEVLCLAMRHIIIESLSTASTTAGPCEIRQEAPRRRCLLFPDRNMYDEWEERNCLWCQFSGGCWWETLAVVASLSTTTTTLLFRGRKTSASIGSTTSFSGCQSWSRTGPSLVRPGTRDLEMADTAVLRRRVRQLLSSILSWA